MFRRAKIKELYGSNQIFVMLNNEIVPVTIKNRPNPNMDFETVVKLPDESEDVFTASSFLIRN